jgi:hypothetical protein
MPAEGCAARHKPHGVPQPEEERDGQFGGRNYQAPDNRVIRCQKVTEKIFLPLIEFSQPAGSGLHN